MFSLLMLDSQSVLRSTWKIFVHFLGDYRTEESCRWVPMVHNGVSKKSDFRTLFRHSIRDSNSFIERWLVFFDELLRTPAGAHLGGVDVAFGIHRNLVKEDKLTSITANPSKAPQFPQCFTIK